MSASRTGDNPINRQNPQTRKKTKWNAKTYDTLSIRIKKDGSDEILIEDIRNAAMRTGESINAFVIQAIRERMDQI